MREFNAINGLPDDVIYKEVVVIGNGPSGICLSYQLAGHWPILRENAEPHPEAMLDARICNTPVGRPLPLQPLHDLAGGLEGRSQNPIPLLIDCLMHPGADMGLDLPSLLEWKYFPEKQIDHVVLGRGKPGGLWHSLDSNVVTLSPSRWMALPGQPKLANLEPQERVPVPKVAEYYQKYVKQCGLQKFFRNHTMVTSVKPIKLVGKRCYRPGMINPSAIAWCVCGYDSANKESFRYVCSRVVLATGASDKPNTIHGSGNIVSLDKAIRTPFELQNALENLNSKLEDNNNCPPILIIGSGLSAADAILRAKSYGFPVAHAYRSPSAGLKALPPTLYPEYHQVYKMMKSGIEGKHHLYTPLPNHIIVEEDGPVEDNETDLKSDDAVSRKIKLLNTKLNELKELDISLCVILIGSRPDLHFLPESFESSYLTFDPDSEKLKPDILMNGNRNINNVNNMKKTNDNINSHSTEMCIKCSYNSANRITHDSICFFKTQWYNFKNIVGHSLQKSKNEKQTKNDNSSNNSAEVQEMSSSGESIDGNSDNRENKNNSFSVDCSMRVNGKDYSVLNNIDENKEKNREERHSISEYEVQGSGIGLGVYPNKPVDSRSNPIFIDKLSHAVQNAPKGLYALGPLTGDNFVRFVPGGALAIVSDIWNNKKVEENDQDCAA